MSKHTEGPWSVAQGDGCFVVETDDSSVRFVVQGLNMEGDQANARLIAAAPDLLDALKRAWVAFSCDDFEPGESKVVDVMRAAKAKAEGEE